MVIRLSYKEHTRTVQGRLQYIYIRDLTQAICSSKIKRTDVLKIQTVYSVKEIQKEKPLADNGCW